jgi:hypothetical protein
MHARRLVLQFLLPFFEPLRQSLIPRPNQCFNFHTATKEASETRQFGMGFSAKRQWCKQGRRGREEEKATRRKEEEEEEG